MSASTEARELELVGKVEMRIALAKDDKFESLLKTYLAPLLLKLGSEHLSVRNKVISTCQHIKIRLAGNQSVVLPVASLLKQYKENPNSSIIRHFDLLFIQQSIGKLSTEDQIDLLPILIHGISQDEDKPTSATIFNLFLRILPQLKIPSRGSTEDAELRKKLGLDDHLDDTKLVATKLGQLVLLNISKITPEASRSVASGLSKEQYEFLTLSGKPETWDPSSPEGLNLTETKVKCLSFLASGAFIDRERFVPALFASADSNSRISSIGEDLLKRSTVSLEDEDVVQELFLLYFPARPTLKTRILILLTKSATATNFADEVLRLMEDGVEPNSSTNAIAGLEAVKFRNSLFNFINWVSRMGSKDCLQRVAPSIISLLKGYIEGQGWPVPNDKSPNALSLRALAYEALGSIAKTAPAAVLDPDLTLINWLFRSLTEEGSSNSIFVSVEESLASLLNIFEKPLGSELRLNLCRLLLHYMTLEEGDNTVRSARFTTVRWANRCLQFDDVVGRWIDILAFGGPPDERSDVVEEGNKGLDPHWYRLLNSVAATESVSLPNWTELVLSIFTGHSILEGSHEANTMKSGMEIDGVSVFGNFSGLKIKAFAPAVKFCRQMLLLAANQQSNQSLDIDAHWDHQLDVLIATDKSSRQTTKSFLESVDQNALELYLTAALEGMFWKDGEGLPGCSAAFVGIASLAPSRTIERLSARARDLLLPIKSNNIDTRVSAAQTFGILAPHPSVSMSSVQKTIEGLLQDIKPWATAIGAEANRIHGYILAVGYLLSRAFFYNRAGEIQDELVQRVVDQLLDIFAGARDTTINDAALIAIGQLASPGLLTEARITKAHSTSDIITKMAELAKKGNEKAISTLGRLTLGFRDTTELTTTILNHLYSLQELRQAETQFAVGEALACASAGWDADCLMLSLDIDSAFEGAGKNDTVLNEMLEKLIADSKTTKPSLQKATGVWLFCLVQYCGHLSEVQSRLRECQAAFMGLLSARDTLVQETASRGLSLVYEQGSKDLKDQLIKDLVSSFTGTKTQVKVDEDTELFDAGALPTGEGQSITSYKDIMSLAAEVGDESLVYKFMSLASNAATWSTRAAFGRFGLSNIMSEGEVDPKLYPKLYRYCRDPNPNVQRSMNDIWNALVKDPSTTIDKYFDDIMEGLLKDVLGKEWRSRQASCAALADLVQGRQFEKYEKYLNRIWGVAFKVLDDIKGSVRGAAMSLCKVLTAILVRQVEAGNTSKNAQGMVNEVLPFLLSTQGMESTVKEVQVFALDTVIKLVKNGGKIILPYTPELVEQLLGLLSTLERAELNYLYLNAANYNLTEEAIDSARSSMVSGSPVMDSIERCLDLLDDDAMGKVIVRLQSVIKTAVGMPSKVGCSGVLVSLATRHSYQFKPHADTILKTLEKAVLDRNSTVSSAYARATGYVARLASDAALLKLATYCKSLYFRSEDDTQRQVSADIVYSVSKFATDRFNSLSSAFLPFTFFAKHDYDKHVEEQFEKTWSENVGGSRAVLLYLSEIITLSTEHLGSAKWAIKHTAALTVADVVKSVGTDLNSSQATTIWPSLEKALALKTFDGKEKVLDAFTKFVKVGKSFWEANTTVAAQMTKIAVREAKRNNETYRPHAFTSIGEYSFLRRDIDIFESIYEIVTPHLQELSDEDRMDTKEDGKTHNSIHAATLNAGISALFKGINPVKTESSPQEELAKVLDVLKAAIRSQDSSISTRTEIYERAKEILDTLVEHKRTTSLSRYDTATALFSLLELPAAAGGETVRMRRAEATEALTSALKADIFGSDREGFAEYKAKILQIVKTTASEERTPSVKAVFNRALEKLEAC